MKFGLHHTTVHTTFTRALILLNILLRKWYQISLPLLKMIKMSLPRALRLHITCPRLQSYLELETGIQPEVQSSWILCSFSFLLHTGKSFLPLNKGIYFIWEVIMGQEASVSYACKKWWKVGTWDIHTDTKQIEYENFSKVFSNISCPSWILKF